jgi:hypothetical protein
MSDVIARANARYALEMIRAGKMSREQADLTLLGIHQSGLDLVELTEELYGKSRPGSPFVDGGSDEDDDWCDDDDW